MIKIILIYLKQELGTLQLYLKSLFFQTRIINKQIINALLRSLFPNNQITGKSGTALHAWAFGSYRDYNMVMRRELRKLIPDFIKKYR